MLVSANDRPERSLISATATVPAELQRWQVLAHLREPERVNAAVRRTSVGGREILVAPPRLLDPPDRGAATALDAVRVLTRDDLPAWIERVRSAAICADRATSPSLLRQLDQSVKRPVPTIVCSLLDPDPQTTLQVRLAAARPDEVHVAVLALMRLLGASRALICCPDDRPVPEPFLKRPARSGAAEPEARVVRNVYPIAEPSVLLLELLGLRLPPGGLPTSVGVLLLDAAAAVDLGRFILSGVPSGNVVMSIRDWRRNESVDVKAPVGCTLGDVLDAAKIVHAGQQLRAGAELRQVAADPDDVVGPGEHVVHVVPRGASPTPTSCIRCGWCADVCPVRALPAGILEAAQRRDRFLGERYGLDACVSCGLCAQVCPSRLPLLSAIERLRRTPVARSGDRA